MPEKMIKGETKIKPEIPLQCPRCGQFLERREGKYLCPIGHVELNTTHEGYPILKKMNDLSTSLAYGGEFKEGAIWHKVIKRCKKAVYVTSHGDDEDDLKVLHHYLSSLMAEFKIVGLDELDRLKIDRQTLILFSRRIGQRNAAKIILKFIGHPTYGYLPGLVVRMGLKLIKQRLSTSIYRISLGRIASRRVEAYYERCLSDRKTAEHFAATYLPQEMQDGKGKHVFDIGCGRGRHSAILSQLGFSITGMDLQPHPYWRRISKANFMVGSAECLSYFSDATFDFVICMLVMEYLNDDTTFLAHIRRLLKPGGYLLLQVPNKENPRTILTNEPLTLDLYLLRYYKQSEICNKLKQYGFTVDQVWNEKFYTPFFVLLGNFLYEFVLSRRLQKVWDNLVSPRHLGLINILARAS